MDDAWADEQWTGDDAPYAAARAQIEHAVVAGQSPLSLMSQYAVQAKKEPSNTLALFRWAYAVRLALMSADFPRQNSSGTLNSASIALAEAPSPHTYNYDRLRYLIWIRGGGGGSYFLKGMAYRLLQKDTRDFAVKMGLVSIYTYTGIKELQQKGYALVQQMIKEYPGKPEGYDMLAAWHFTQYLRYHDAGDYRQAMACYQKAMRLYPATASRKAQLPKVMQYLQTRHHQISGG